MSTLSDVRGNRDSEPGDRFQVRAADPFAAAPRRALAGRCDRGIISLIASDHSPAPPTLKNVESGDFISAWGGIASLELSLRAVWTGASRRGFTLTDVVRWMSERPARLCGLDARKGAIQRGCDADLVLFDPDSRGVVKSGLLQQRHKLTPYDGYVLSGAVRATYLARRQGLGRGKTCARR